MLRITTFENAHGLTLRLEGRLEGPWVEVLKQCWVSATDTHGKRRVRVDLNGVTFVDGQGKGGLEEMYANGVELISDELMTRAIVAEIVGHDERA